jgi:prepilin-type N-terminal cleavage/methylation domain-containing protein
MTKNNSRGFTLIELLVVFVVIAILLSIGYPALIGALARAKVTKDMNNLRQIGIATQLYMNDNDGTLPGSTTLTWMSQLNPRYVSVWRIFQSPFDTRGSSESGNATTPVSYGINANVFGTSASKITKPTIFILFAPAQDSTTTSAQVNFQGTAATAAPGVKVVGADLGKATSSPGGNATAGTNSNGQKTTALFGDLHCENMAWGSATNTGVTFTNNQTRASSDPDGGNRWTP